jgi:hypothetical protein
MSKINKDELFTHVSDFLKARGIDLQAGSYTRTIEKGCQVLADTINLSQQALERAKIELEEKLERARDVIHKQTAPRKPPVMTQASSSASATGARTRKAGRVRKSGAGSPSPRRKNPSGT